MNRFTRLFITAVPILLSHQAYADDGPCCRPIPRWYGSVSGSAVFLTDSEIKFKPAQAATVNSTPVSVPGLSEGYNVGYGMGGALGYRFYPDIRGELEVTYRVNDLSSVEGASYHAPSGTQSDESSLAVMANGYYDYHNDSKLTPYFGVGIGEAHVKNPLEAFNNGTTLEPLTASGWAMAYQFMAGVNYEIPNSPMELIFGYRYFGTEDINGSFTSGQGKLSFTDSSQSLELGLRVFFK